jgi:serine/threonine-protein kinase
LPGEHDPTELLAPGTMVGEYRVHDFVAEGGMATVYRAIQPTIAKRVAVKVLSASLSADAAAVSRFVDEARAVNQIRHPNIIDVFSFGRLADGRFYFVMEWLSGETLYRRIGRGRPSDLETLGILVHVCEALEAAHEVGIIHRDIKPENVFLVHLRGRVLVKLLDFGLAKLAGKLDMSDGRRTKPGMAVGTPAFISPEQARGEEVTAASDLYSLGVLAYELLTGKLPFEAELAIDQIHMHLHDPPPPPAQRRPDLAPELCELLVAMLAKEAAQRPSMAHVRAVFESRLRDLGGNLASMTSGSMPAYDGGPDQTPDAVALPPAKRALRRRRMVPIAVLVLALSVGGVAAWARFGRKTPTMSVQKAPTLKVEPPVVPPAPPPATPSLLVVHASPPGARIAVDGRELEVKAGTASLEVAPGREHHVVVSASHRDPVERRVRLNAGQTLELEIQLHSTRAASNSANRPPASKRGDVDYMMDPFARPK